MSNMSYCRHENTLSDLRDVWENWDDFDPEQATRQEIHARKALRELVMEMADEFSAEDE